MKKQTFTRKDTGCSASKEQLLRRLYLLVWIFLLQLWYLFKAVEWKLLALCSTEQKQKRDISSPQHGVGREGALRGWKGPRCAGPRGLCPRNKASLFRSQFKMPCKIPLFGSLKNAHTGVVGGGKEWMLMAVYCSKNHFPALPLQQKAPHAKQEAFEGCPKPWTTSPRTWMLEHHMHLWYKNPPGMLRTLVFNVILSF